MTDHLPAAAIRTEIDSIGAVDLPADARWGIHTQRSLDALSFSGRTLGSLPGLVRGLGAVKEATATANGATGRLPEDRAAAIVAAARRLPDPDVAHDLVADPFAGGGGIAVHVNANEVIAALAAEAGAPGIDARTEVGASQSTVDVLHTAGRLAVLAEADLLLAVAAGVEAALASAADRAGSRPTLARTCLQDGLAVPSRLLFDGATTTLRRRADAVAAALDPLQEVVLGATVVGTGEGASDAYRAAVVPALAAAAAPWLAGRTLAAETDPAGRLQHSDDLVAVADAVAQLASAAAKVARDLRLLASGPEGGFGEVDLPTVMEGSAFFVGKVNPAVPESVVQAAIWAGGLAHVTRAAAEEAELHLSGYDLTAVVSVLDQIGGLRRALDHFDRHCLRDLTVDHDRAAELAAHATPTKDAP